MSRSTVISLQDREQIVDPSTDLLRTGARRLLEQAILAELEDMLFRYPDQQTVTGHATVVRYGYLPQRGERTYSG